MNKIVFLIVNADGTARLMKRASRQLGDVSFKLTLAFPDSWVQLITQEITIDIPEIAPDLIVDEVEQ